MPRWLLIFPALAFACAHEVPKPIEPADPADRAQQAQIPKPAPAPLTEAERLAQLDTACGDPTKFADLALGTAVRDRTVMEKIAAQYLDRCGLKDTLELTSKLIEFPTVSAREPSSGDAFHALRDYLAAWTKNAGLDFIVFGENDAWIAGFGSGAPSVAFVMHGDVVPIDEDSGGTAPKTPPHGAIDALTGEPLPAGWTKPPFRATVEDGKLFGRGSEDDKGPIAAALIVLRTMAKLDLQPKGRLLAIIGTGEEHDWSGMKRYVDAMSPLPRFTISVDANFPVVVAESGFVAWQLAAPMTPSNAKNAKSPAKCATAIDAKGGAFLTQVPGDASLTLEPPKGEKPDRFRARVEAAANEAKKQLGDGYRFELEARGDKLELRAYGEAVHSSTADEGKNALWALALAGDRVGLCNNGLRAVLALIAKKLSGDLYGERLGIAYQHPLMLPLLVVPTLLRVEGGEAKLSINMRRPAGLTSAEFGKKLDALIPALAKELGAPLHESGDRYIGEPALADTEGPLVPTLIELYRAATGDANAKPISIRGGTYARLFPGAVSFGPSLPGRKYRGHAPDEYVELESLKLLDRLLFEAALKLDAAPKE